MEVKPGRIIEHPPGSGSFHPTTEVRFQPYELRLFERLRDIIQSRPNISKIVAQEEDRLVLLGDFDEKYVKVLAKPNPDVAVDVDVNTDLL